MLVAERIAARNGATHEPAQAPRVRSEPATKVCDGCGEAKPAAAFEKYRRRCRECRRRDRRATEHQAPGEPETTGRDRPGRAARAVPCRRPRGGRPHRLARERGLRGADAGRPGADRPRRRARRRHQLTQTDDAPRRRDALPWSVRAAQESPLDGLRRGGRPRCGGVALLYSLARARHRGRVGSAAPLRSQEGATQCRTSRW